MDRFYAAVLFSMNYPGDPNRTYAGPEELAILHKILSRPQDYLCPFCSRLPCAHWNGYGWVNPKFHLDTSPVT